MSVRASKSTFSQVFFQRNRKQNKSMSSKGNLVLAIKKWIPFRNKTKSQIKLPHNKESLNIKTFKSKIPQNLVLLVNKKEIRLSV